MPEHITITLTRDELVAIKESLEFYDYNRLKLWQLDEFDTGTDKADYITRIENKIADKL
jgi:hypothetical protein